MSTGDTAMFDIKQVQEDVPVWDFIDAGFWIGCMTNFPGEGPVATIRVGGVKVTVAGATIHEVLRVTRENFEELDGANEGFIPDEDGSEAFARMLERRAEGHGDEEEPFH
jgi:hypothetical protein